MVALVITPYDFKHSFKKKVLRLLLKFLGPANTRKLKRFVLWKILPSGENMPQRQYAVAISSLMDDKRAISLNKFMKKIGGYRQDDFAPFHSKDNKNESFIDIFVDFSGTSWVSSDKCLHSLES